MKITHLTTLKHKLQWLVLLASLLGMSQGVWANGSANGPKAVYLTVNNTTSWYNVYSTSWSYTGCTNYSSLNSATSFSGDLGTVTTLTLKGFAFYGWADESNNFCTADFQYQIDSNMTQHYYLNNYNDLSKGANSNHAACSSNNDRCVGYKSSSTNLLSGLSVGSHTLKITPYYKMGWQNSSSSYGEFNDGNNSQVSATFTIPGWSTTSGSKAFGSVNVGSYSSETISLGTHYGASSTATSSITGTNASDFSVTSVSATSVTVRFTPSAAGSRTATVTITDAYDKTYTLTVSGTGVTSCTATAPTLTATPPSATSIKCDRATLGGEVTDKGQNTSCETLALTTRGVKVYSNSACTDAYLVTTKNHATADATGSYTVTATGLSAGTTYYYKSYAVNATGTSYSTNYKSFTTKAVPAASDITISAPSSATTLYLGSGSAPSITQTVTATCSKGSQWKWTATPATYSYSGAWTTTSSTATRVAFATATNKSTTATFYHEGVYTATFNIGCGNYTDATKNAPTITVKPGHLYFDGPFFSGSGYDLTKQHVEINTSTDEFVYEWTANSNNAAGGDFVVSVGNACNNEASSSYTIGNYAELTLTGVTKANSGNHNFSPNIGTITVGDRLKFTVAYTGVNASGVPKYSVTLEKVCSNPTVQTVSGTATICSGSSTNVTVASSQSKYTYKLYKGGSATATTKAGTGSALNFSVSAAGTYTVHAYYTSGSDAYCKADMSGSAIVTVTPTASIGSVTLTSSSVCIGQGLSATANDVVLGGGTGAWSSSNTSVANIAANGNITPVGAGSTNITYTITGGCGGTVSAYATLTVKPNAAAAQYTLSNNTQTYNGAPRSVTITPATGAGTATVYYSSASYAKSTTGPINAGTYTVTVDAAAGTNYCAASDINVGTFTINKANQSTLTISNTLTTFAYCSGAHTTLTTSGGSGDGAVTYTVTSGSGDVDGDVLSPSAKGSVSVTATKAASTNYNATTSAAKTFNFNVDAPTVYTLSNVGGATTICGDPSTGAGSGTLRLANSQTGYNYQLYSNGSPVEGYAAKAGTTGSSIDFPVTSSGTYTVYAYYGTNSSNCATQMNGEITLTISTQPKLVRSAATVTQYIPVTVTCISTDIYTWEVSNEGSTAYLYDQTYNSIDFKGASTDASTAKTYTITATTKGGCSESTTITVNPDSESCD